MHPLFSPTIDHVVLEHFWCTYAASFRLAETIWLPKTSSLALKNCKRQRFVQVETAAFLPRWLSSYSSKAHQCLPHSFVEHSESLRLSTFFLCESLPIASIDRQPCAFQPGWPLSNQSLRCDCAELPSRLLQRVQLPGLEQPSTIHYSMCLEEQRVALHLAHSGARTIPMHRFLDQHEFLYLSPYPVVGLRDPRGTRL